jgi:hypothetical protein
MAMRRPPTPKTVTMVPGNRIFFKNAVFFFTSDTNESSNSKFPDMAASFLDPIIRKNPDDDIYKYAKGNILQ